MADIIVSGAGTTAVNGTYVETGIYNGKPAYYYGALYIIWSYTAKWEIRPSTKLLYYYSTDNVATPDLATWNVGTTGTSPVPTVTAAGGPQSYTLTCAAGSYSLTGTNVTLTATVKQNLTLACSAGNYLITGTDVTLTVQRNYTLVCESASGGAYPDIAVSGAGTSEANGTYVENGTYNSRPIYYYSIYRLQWSGSAWEIVFPTTKGYLIYYYVSTDDVATPDLCTTWTKGAAGVLPVPTVTADAATTYVLTGTNADLTVTRHYTLTCEAGSYSLTGTNADLTVKRNYVLACAAGSYSLTGTDCTLSVGGAYPDMIVSGAGTTAVNGTYVENGTTNGKPLYVFGSYTISWSNNIWAIGNPTFQYYSTDDVATPDLCTSWTKMFGGLPVPTVTAASSSQNLTLTCEAGSYSLTGTNADLTVKRNYVLNLAYPDIIVSGAGTPVEYVNGTYSFAGMQDGKPSYSAPLDGWNGEIRWFSSLSIWTISTGGGGDEFKSTDDVATPNLVTTWTLGEWYEGATPPTVTGNSYKLTGSDATLTVQRNYTLVCEPGSYTYTGTDITFGNSKAYSLTCEAGAYTLTGSSVSFVIQRNYSLACETGSYSLTGTDVTLTYTQGAQNFTLACETGSYALTGTNADLTSARTMALESGSYALTGTNADFYRALVMACEAGSYALTGTNASLTSHRIFALGVGSYVLVGTSVGLFILSPTPACRTFAIPHENRTATIEFENRTLEVKCH